MATNEQLSRIIDMLEEDYDVEDIILYIKDLVD